MNDNVGTVFNGPTQVGSRKRAVDDQRNPRIVGNISNSRYVEHIVQRIPNGLGIKRFRFWGYRACEILRVFRINEMGSNTKAAKPVIKLGVSTTKLKKLLSFKNYDPSLLEKVDQGTTIQRAR